MDILTIKNIFSNAQNQNRDVLLEPEGLAVLELMDISIPKYIFLPLDQDPDTINLEFFPSDKLVVKVVSSEILHKTDLGAIKIIPKDKLLLQNTIESFVNQFKKYNINGFTIHEHIPYESFLGSEILLSIRWTEDFGFIITYGIGGIYTEFMSKDFASQKTITMFSPQLIAESDLQNNLTTILNKVAITKLLTISFRGQNPKIDINKIINIINKMIILTKNLNHDDISELEVNPLIIYQGNIIALDILCKLNSQKDKYLNRCPRPINKINFLLNPKNIGIIGVSQGVNPGHIIINNLLALNFKKENIFIIKPNTNNIEGCKCYESIETLPQKLDVLIFGLNATKFPQILAEVIKEKKAESIIVIAGGFEEKQGTEDLMSAITKILTESRQTEWQGPIINGPNCLGIYSPIGNYNTFFIPEYKLKTPECEIKPLAIISQSGGFACSKTSKLGHIKPKYVISLGNQMDLTIGDYLTYLKTDQEIEVFAIYIEGFKQMDGLVFLKAAKEIIDSGRKIILYCSGRTQIGAKTSVSHTASIAGDYIITKNLTENIGINMVDTITDFEKLTELFVLFNQYNLTGNKIAAISNSGFVNVAIADNIQTLEFSQLSELTNNQLKSIFSEQKIDTVVDINNPIDLTATINDNSYMSVTKIIMNDSHVDVVVINLVPLTISLNSLPPSQEHKENIFQSDSLTMQLISLKKEIHKPFIVIIDSGFPYNTMAHLLENAGIPVFRTAEQAAKLLDIVCQSKLSEIKSFKETV